MGNKKLYIIFGILVIMGLTIFLKNNNKTNENALKFKNEYESLNTELNKDGSNKYNN